MMYHLVNNYIVFEFIFLILIVIYVMFGLSCFVEYLYKTNTIHQHINKKLRDIRRVILVKVNI